MSRDEDLIGNVVILPKQTVNTMKTDYDHRGTHLKL